MSNGTAVCRYFDVFLLFYLANSLLYHPLFVDVP
jgi:hypothetical protein